MKQRTIATQITARSSLGEQAGGAQCLLKPASENEGIVLCRTDLPARPEFKLGIDTLKSVLPSTSLQDFDLVSFFPLCGVLRALNIDNIRIECNSRSFPDLGEASSTLLFLVQSAGIKQQNALRKSITLTSPVMIKSEKGAWVRLMPSAKRRMAVLNSQPHKPQKIAVKNAMMDFTPAFFTSELCHARAEHVIENEAAGFDLTDDIELNYSRLSEEKTHRMLFDAFSVLSIVPYLIHADYVAFNATQKDILDLLVKLISSESYVLETDLTLESGSSSQEHKKILAV